MRSKWLWLALALAGCLGKKDVRRAQTVAYQTDFAAVWQVVTDETRRRYTPPEMMVDDPIVGKLKSNWVKIAADTDDNLRSSSPGTTVDPNARLQASEGSGAILMQMEVRVVGGPPWRVIVEGKGARYVPNLVQIIPYDRGGADEPATIQARIDGLSVAIYKRLQKYAVEVKGPPPTAKRTLDTKKFGDVPPDAAQIVGTVQAAARKRELEILRPLLVPEFVWSEAAAGSADQALALWGADPSSLSELAVLLEKGCGNHLTEKVVTCPPTAPPDGSGTGPRAGFRQVAEGWRFAFFLRE